MTVSSTRTAKQQTETSNFHERRKDGNFHVESPKQGGPRRGNALLGGGRRRIGGGGGQRRTGLTLLAKKTIENSLFKAGG